MSTKRRRIVADDGGAASPVDLLANSAIPVEDIPEVSGEELLDVLLSMATKPGGAFELMWLSNRIKEYLEEHDISVPQSSASMRLVQEYYMAMRDTPETGVVPIHALDGIFPCDFVLRALVFGPLSLSEISCKYTEKHCECFKDQMGHEVFSEEGATLLQCLSVVMGQSRLKEEVRFVLYTCVVVCCSFFVRSERIPDHLWGAPWMPKLCMALCAGLRTESTEYWQPNDMLCVLSTRRGVADISHAVPRFLVLSTMFSVSGREQEGSTVLKALRTAFEASWRSGRWTEAVYRSGRDNPLLPLSVRLWLNMFGNEVAVEPIMMTKGFVLRDFEPQCIMQYVALASEMNVKPTFHLEGSYGEALDVQVVSNTCREVPRFGVFTAMQTDRGVYVRRLGELLRLGFKIHAKVPRSILPENVLEHFVGGRRMQATDEMRSEVLERLGNSLPLPDMPQYGGGISGAVFQTEDVGKYMEVRSDGRVRVLEDLKDAISDTEPPWEAVQWVYGSSPLLERFVARVASVDQDKVVLETGDAFHAPRTCVTLSTEAERADYVERVCEEYCRLADVLIATAFDCALPMPRPITAEAVAKALFDGETPEVRLEFAADVPRMLRRALQAYLRSGGKRAQALLRDFAFGDRRWDGPCQAPISVKLLPRETDAPPPPPRSRMCFGQLFIPGGHWTNAAMAAYLDHYLPQGTAGGFSEIH